MFSSALTGTFSTTGLEKTRKPWWFGAGFFSLPWTFSMVFNFKSTCPVLCSKKGSFVGWSWFSTSQYTSKGYFLFVFCGPLQLFPIKLLFLPFCNLLFHFICLLYSFTFINQNPRIQLISFPCCCASAAIFFVWCNVPSLPLTSRNNNNKVFGSISRLFRRNV